MGRFVLLAGAALALTGCSSIPSSLIVNGVTLGAAEFACDLKTYAADKAKNLTPVETALDIANACGSDLAQIVGLFGESDEVSKAAASNAGQVHAMAMRKNAPPAPAPPQS